MNEMDEIVWSYVQGCTRAYLGGKQNFNWIKSITAGFNDQKLQEFVKNYDGDDLRKKELLGWLQND